MAFESLPAAAFWIRIGQDLKDDAAYEKWRTSFSSAKATVEVTPQSFDYRAGATDGPLRIVANAPFVTPATTEPQPSRRFLALDGDDLGRKILDGIPQVAK
jgi:hypothetical protein